MIDEKVRYEDYLKKRADFAVRRAKLGLKREASSRVRDEEEGKLLLEFDKARLERWKKEGKLVKLGPRKYRFNV
ncbi:MAG: hypothetical protein QMD66_02235 [Actinomycetota bacterium]|nr:hypothetical protein [Actinomycetota bacterium]